MGKNNLGITEGDWSVTKGGFMYGVYQNKTQICLLPVKEDSKSNAKLIADAGTTANKCGKLPSEILKERDECMEVLEELLRLKISKDALGKTDQYLKKQPIAWGKAREVLEKIFN